MELLLLAVGRLRPELRSVADDYLRRLRRSQSITEHEIRELGRESRRADGWTEQDRRIVRRLPENVPLTLLDIGGEGWSSEQLATRLDRWRLAAVDRALVIGGADGVGAGLRDRANECWSLGPLTLPHQLVRVLVLEQLYRADTILAGKPYHRGER